MLLFSTMRNIHIVNAYTPGRICLKRAFLPRGKYCFAEGWNPYIYRWGLPMSTTSKIAFFDNGE